MQDESKSHHQLFYNVGTIVCAISDHFINFIQLSIDNPKPKLKEVIKRKSENIARFKHSI